MVFKAYLKLVPSYLNQVIMYMVIFAVLLAMVVVGTDNISAGSGTLGGFASLVSVNDLDGTEESKALISYLENSPNIKLIDIDFDKESAVQDSLYNRKTEYVLTVKKGFGESLQKGEYENILSSEVIGGSSYESFVGNEIDTYMSAVRLYIIGGSDSVTACAEAAKTLENGVKVTSYQQEEGWNEENKAAYYFYNFIPYIMIMMILAILVPTFSTFLNDEMRSRSLCSPISPVRYTFQIIAGAFVISIAISLVLLVTGLIITQGRLFNDKSVYSLIQMFIFMLFSLGVSALVGILCSSSIKNSPYVTSMVSNVLGLGMAFMCGVFVKQSLLGEGVLNASKLLPAYWYVRGNNLIMGGDGAVFDKGEVMVCITVQALFALAVFAAALLAASLKRGRRASK
ncbi:MAG: ABC transporter permease [Ruminococcaceae bacterium]|nr:ABC transporter permease [Oscillospiraceae bacterium]